MNSFLIEYKRLSSWSYTNTEFPDDLQELIAKSRIGADAMQEVANSKIITGNSGLLFGMLIYFFSKMFDLNICA